MTRLHHFFGVEGKTILFEDLKISSHLLPIQVKPAEPPCGGTPPQQVGPAAPVEQAGNVGNGGAAALAVGGSAALPGPTGEGPGSVRHDLAHHQVVPSVHEREFRRVDTSQLVDSRLYIIM